MKQRFYVDWSDPPFPQIRPIEDGSDYAEPVTITEARQEIVDHFRAIVDHARNQIMIVKQVTVKSIMDESEASKEY